MRLCPGVWHSTLQPEVEAKRETILLPSDLPSPANPPHAYRFQTRCPTSSRRAARPRAPRLRGPSPAPVGPGHWAEEIKGRPPPAAPTRGRLRSPSARSGAGTAACLAPILLGVLARTGRERQRHAPLPPTP